MSARALPVLMYHHVSPNPGLVTISPATFRRQMAWLHDHGWHTVACDDLSAFLDGQPLPKKSVLLTFDDGYLDNWIHAHPVLREFGLTASIFLITGWIGDGAVRVATADCPNHKDCMAAVRAGEQARVMMNWAEVEAMRRAGTGEFHSHTHSHIRWDQRIAQPAERGAALAQDLVASRAALEAHLGTCSSHLCWPQGYFDAAYQNTALAAGFTHLYTTEKGTCRASTAITAIPRIVVKDRAGAWFTQRLWLYQHPLLTRIYLALQNRKART